MSTKKSIQYATIFAVLSASVVSSSLEARVPSLYKDTIGLSGDYATSGGEATYTLPIIVSAGRAGHQPELSLDYNSDSPNGIMGMGWSLGGQSVIYRCGKNLETDGKWGGVHFNSDDRFCIDGQRLIAVEGADGGDLTEYRIKKNGYNKIVSFGSSGSSGPAYFKVWKTDGSVLEYGVTSDSRVELPTESDVYKWSLNKRTDASKQNHILYHYREDNAGGSHQLASVSYTGGKVEFVYENREDKTSQYLHGKKLVRDQRLKRINTFDAEGMQTGNYQLDYQYSKYTGRSLLLDIEYGNASGGSSTPISFSWNEPSATRTTFGTPPIVNTGNLSIPEIKYKIPRVSKPLDFAKASYFDVNRDGYKEPFGVKEKSTTLFSCSYKNFFDRSNLGSMLSLDGVSSKPGLAGYTLVGSIDSPQLLPRPNKFTSVGDCGPNGRYSKYEYRVDDDILSAQSYMPNLDGVLVEVPNVPNVGNKIGLKYISGDFNGDGKQTLRERIYVRNKMTHVPMHVLDIDNDGIDDWVYVYGKQFVYSLSHKGHKTFSVPIQDKELCVRHLPSLQKFCNNLAYLTFNDFNNDGYKDFAVVNNKAKKIDVFAFNGIGYEKQGSTYNLPGKEHKVEFIDYNGDGYPELYVDGKFYINHGGDFDLTKPIDTPEIKDIYLVEDINGDGIDDFVSSVGKAPKEKSKTHISTGLEIDRINVIKEQARTFKIEYKPASDKSVHAQKRYFDYPYLNTTPSKQLVANVVKEPKGYIATRYSYHYEGAKSHALGGGFLGFAKITEVETNNGSFLVGNKYDFVTTTTVSEYHQLDLKRSGELKKVSVYKQGKGAKPFVYRESDKVSATDFSYISVDRTNSAFQVYPNKVVKKSYENGALQKTETITRKLNAFGALTKEESTLVNAKDTRDAFTTTVDNTYVSSGYTTTSVTYNTISRHQVSDMSAQFARYQDGLTGYCSTSNDDVYFKPNDKFVLIHGEVDIPILVTRHNEYYRYRVAKSQSNSYSGITQRSGELTQISRAEFERQATKPCGDFTFGNIIGDSHPELSTTTANLSLRVTQSGNEYWQVGAVKHTTSKVTAQQHGLSKLTLQDYAYTQNGLVSSVRTSGSEYEPGSGSGRTLTTAYQYDAWGNIRQESQYGSDLARRTTTYGYEQNGLKLKTTTNAKGHTTTWEYDAQGRLLSETSPLKGRKTRYQYDMFGRVKVATLPGTGNTVFTDYQLGAACMNALATTAHCITVRKADGSEQQTQFDYADREVRRLHRAFDGRWVVVDSEWDQNGRKRFVTAAKFLNQAGDAPRVTFDYDLYNREVRRIEPANRGGLAIFTTRYDGYKIEGTDARGFKRSTTHNVMGQVIRKEEPLGAYQTYQYYPDGKLRRTVDSDGNVTQVKYDNLGYRTELDDPDIGHWHYRYNALGQLVYKRDANGIVTTMGYDTLGRKVTQNDGSEESQWRYDERGALGTLSWMSGKGQRTDYFYNSNGLLQEKAVTVGQEIFSTQYEYDKLERLGREVRPDGQTLKSALGKKDDQRLAVEYLYNQFGYLGAVRSPRTYADDIFTSAKFREDIRQLLSGAINQANTYLQRASRYARQEQLFRTKQLEYERKRVDVYNLDSASAALLKDNYRYKQWCDGQNTCYLRPATWVILHDDITIPLDVTLEGQAYRITSEKDGDIWNAFTSGLQAHDLTATAISEQELAGLSLTQMKDMLLSGDYDDDGQPDIMHQGDIYSAKADDELRGELLFAAEDLEQAANIANRQYKQYKALAADMIGLSEKVAKLSGLYCEFANDLAGNRVDASLRKECRSNGGVGQADMLDTILTNAELAAANKNNAYVYYWQRQSTDAFDHTLSEMLGNGLMNTYDYDADTGRMNAIATYQGNHVYSSDKISKPSRNQHIRYLRYQYDEHNNVTQRFDDQLGITDIWTYDALDRVETNTMVLVDKARHGINNPDLTGKRSFEYDKLGNIRHKSDVGVYQYSEVGAGPHAVTNANGLDYSYDAVGNMTSAKAKGSKSNERTIRWSPFNKPINIVREGKSVEFSYDANHDRYLKQSSDGKVTFYFGKTYEREKDLKTGEIQHKHFIFAEGKLIALNTQTLDSENQLKNKQVRYLHYDALDSVDMVTDGYGLVVEKRSYDTWGKQRHVEWQDKSAASVVQSAITNRGYTGHEEITEVGLIHMNGRVYDQVLGRFTSADPLVQSPYVVNSFNRYAYVMNNPLKYTDPTGLSSEDSGVNSGDSGANNGTGDGGKDPSNGKPEGTGGGKGQQSPDNKDDSLSTEKQQEASEEEKEVSGWGIFGDALQLAYDLSPISTVVDVTLGTIKTAEALAAGEFKEAAEIAGSAVFGVVAKKIKAPAKFAGSVYNKVEKALDAPAYARNKYKQVPRKLKAQVLEENPDCAYCGSKPSTQVDHIRSLKQDWKEGGYLDTREVRSARVNDPSNLTGSCASCNASKGSKELGDGPGQWSGRSGDKE
ncbi:SpvB/TcaC N-terminal domain-containing protein [Vibrio alginolyticus]|uniref:SpvB/TcaC N-terminal domain-containing protein n=1 Tax=Vibrio alginolyticus TaxID=663 RepID=UPI002FEF72EF